MRGLFAGLLVALLIAVVALAIAAVGSLGVAAIGWLLNHWFGLSQWQGTLIALIVTLGLGFLVYKLAAQPAMPVVWDPDWDDWEPEEDDADVNQPPVVPWRRSRPTPGELPAEKSAPPSATGRKRK